MKVLLDSNQYQAKPTDASTISARLNKSEATLENIQELAAALVQGQTVCPSTFNGKRRNNANWEQQQVFCLDFDSGLTVEEALNRLQDIKLQHSFFYHTFSHTAEKPKFRIVFHTSEPITSKIDRDFIQKTLMLVFPECDKACKDASRLFYGGKALLHEEYEPLQLDMLFELAEVFTVANTKDAKNVNRELKKLADFDVKTVNACIYKAKTVNPSIFDKRELPPMLDNVNISELVSELDILQSFVKGSADGIWPDGYLKLKGIITNMMYIKGGLAWVKSVMDGHGYFNPWHYALLTDLKRKKYLPTNLANFSPADSHHVNILAATGKGVYSAVRTNEVLDVYTLPYAEKLLTRAFSNALNSTPSIVTVIKTATGLGKTRLLENLPKDARYTIAAPTHALKNEIHSRILNNSKNKNEFYVTPELPKSLPVTLRAEMDAMYLVGAHEAARALLRDYRERCEDNSVIDELDAYTEANAQAYADSKTHSVITTHTKALRCEVDYEGNNQFPFASTQTLIIDEDPLKSFFPQGHVTMQDLFLLQQALPESFSVRKSIAKLLNVMEKAEAKTIFLNLNISDEEWNFIITETSKNYHKYRSNIIAFLKAGIYRYSKDMGEEGKLSYIVKEALPTKRTIILSASADRKIYELVFGDRLRFIDISHVLPEGSITNNSKFSCSRRSLKNPKVSKYVNNSITDKMVAITHLSSKDLIKNSSPDIHFGNCAGYDSLKGKDLAIVGCPRSRTVDYAMLAIALGIELEEEGIEMVTKRVNFNGYIFPFKTYKNDFLSRIQMSLIDGEQQQAIGRARILRTPANVIVFSGFLVQDYKGKLNIIGEAAEPQWLIEGYECKLSPEKELVYA